MNFFIYVIKYLHLLKELSSYKLFIFSFDFGIKCDKDIMRFKCSIVS